MSFEPDNEDSENKQEDIAEESLRYLKVIACLLADMQDENLAQLLNDIEGI